MPKVLNGVPRDGSGSVSATVNSLKAHQYTLAVYGNSASYVTVNLYGAFTEAFDPEWLITSVTACEGGATGSGRYVDSDDYFPYKRVVASLSGSFANACTFGVWLENRTIP